GDLELSTEIRLIGARHNAQAVAALAIVRLGDAVERVSALLVGLRRQKALDEQQRVGVLVESHLGSDERPSAVGVANHARDRLLALGRIAEPPAKASLHAKPRVV